MDYKYQPKNKDELIEAIKKEIYEVQGTKDNPNWNADLNCIDTSLIEDMSRLFYPNSLGKFNGNISKWNTSKVKNMLSMFAYSKFNQPINDWDTGNVRDMQSMFAFSEFNQYINNWNVSKVENMEWMFTGSDFNQPLDKWNTSRVEIMAYMFKGSPFNQDINNWNVSNVRDMVGMFEDSDFNQYIGDWKLNKSLRDGVYCMVRNSPLELEDKELTSENFKQYMIEATGKYEIQLEDLKQKMAVMQQALDTVSNINSFSEQAKEIENKCNEVSKIIEELENKLNNSNDISNKQTINNNQQKVSRPKM